MVVSDIDDESGTETAKAIVNIGSTTSVRPLRTGAGYTASKHAVVGLTKTASTQLAPRGIRVNAVLPGATPTPMVLLGRWLAAEATVLLLDEPTVGVDVGSKADIQNQVLELAEQGLAVVVIASEFSQLEEMCHRVLVVSGRAVQAELVGPQITEATLLAACFGASDNEVRVGDG